MRVSAPASMVRLSPPAGKSELIRMMLLAGTADGPTTVQPGNPCRDVLAAARALEAMGQRVSVGRESVTVEPGPVPGQRISVDAGESGLVARCTIGLAAFMPHAVAVDGAAGLRVRPMGPLLAALRGVGVQVQDQGGGLPVVVGQGLPATRVLHVEAKGSSQFVTALLLGIVASGRGGTLHVQGLTGSQGYVDLTLQCMARVGVPVSVDGQTFTVPPGRARPGVYRVEADWSGGANLVAAAVILGRPVLLENLTVRSLQPDRAILDLLSPGISSVEQARDGLALTPRHGGWRPGGFDVDLARHPDLGPLLVVLATMAEGPSRLRAVQVLRLKESDRLAASMELASMLGAGVSLDRGDLTVVPGEGPSGPMVLPCHGDHRIAMAAGLASLVWPGVAADEPWVVDKSYPGFWDDLARVSGHGGGQA